MITHLGIANRLDLGGCENTPILGIGQLVAMKHYQRQLTSTELIESSLASLVWLIAVPSVGKGGFVTPIVPVAMTPAGNDCAYAPWPCIAKAERRAEVDAVPRLYRITMYGPSGTGGCQIK